jgi:hypothetical protein
VELVEAAFHTNPTLSNDERVLFVGFWYTHNFTVVAGVGSHSHAVVTRGTAATGRKLATRARATAPRLGAAGRTTGAAATPAYTSSVPYTSSNASTSTIVTRHYILALNASSGEQLWNVSANSSVSSVLAVSNKTWGGSGNGTSTSTNTLFFGSNLDIGAARQSNQHQHQPDMSALQFTIAA